MRGAGGSDGGEFNFLIGLVMMVAGGYLLLSNIVIRPIFGMGTRAFGMGGYDVTTGMILIPFMFGVAMVFYNGRSKIGWGLAIGSVIALVVGVISNLTLQFSNLSAFDLLVILVLLFGGIGLFLRSLRG
ncbi:hypothetical protein MWU61_01705 [Loktanella sp. F6476L]|uniref:hypothetical protein n=1 Tax=Loktanella sp. F6476L TaxID=2926405 RepID=UPI001FF67E7B|nr:hypothetical protein [Loktanella sp. F6476L]MCK0119239.1 hypothetical protein [Loktanella sp. F6476L]